MQKTKQFFLNKKEGRKTASKTFSLGVIFSLTFLFLFSFSLTSATQSPWDYTPTGDAITGNCPDGYAVQNVTGLGLQCVEMPTGGSVSVNSTQFSDDNPLTINQTWLTTFIQSVVNAYNFITGNDVPDYEEDPNYFSNPSAYYNSTTLQNLSQLNNDMGLVNGTDGINGTNGIDGLNGTDGQSTYIETEDLNDGTFLWKYFYSNGTNYANFTTSDLTGPQGIQGIQGPAGVDGINGTNGIDGINGTFTDILNATQFQNESTTWSINTSWLSSFIESVANALTKWNDYFTKTEILGFNYYNSTTLENVSQLDNDAGYLTAETDPLSLHLDQNTPQDLFSDGAIEVGLKSDSSDSADTKAGFYFRNSFDSMMGAIEFFNHEVSKAKTILYGYLGNSDTIGEGLVITNDEDDLIVQLPSYTSDGFIKTSNSDGTLIVDTNEYVNFTALDNSTIIRQHNTSWITDNQNNYNDTWINGTFYNKTSNIDATGYNITADYFFGDGSQLTNLPIPEINLTPYALLNGTNQPFTGNLEIRKTNPEMKLTNLGNTSYTRLFRFDGNHSASRTNIITRPAPGGISYSTTGSPIVTTDGDYTVVRFNASGTFTVTAGSADIEVFVLGGGAGGGGSGQYYGGGGGGGSINYSASFPVTTQTYTVTVGTGGAGGASGVQGTNGGTSSFGTMSALGGGGGAYGSSSQQNGTSLGTGGGGGGTFTGNPVGIGGTGSNGGNGGNGAASSANTNAGGGGGGGSTGNGGTATTAQAGHGGTGTANSITGTSVTYGGGGGGGTSSSTSGNGGTGGGGKGGQGDTAPVSGINGLGGGGGGSSRTLVGGAKGGSGVVIVRFIEATEAVKVEATIWKADNGAEFNEEGIITFGYEGTEAGKGSRTVIDGQTIRLNLNGVEKARLNSNGFGINTNSTNPVSFPLTVFGSVNGTSAWFEGNISAEGYITRTQVKTGNQLQTIKDGSELLNEDGTINHEAFGECYVEYDKLEFSHYEKYRIGATTHQRPIYITVKEQGVDTTCQQAKLTQALSNINKAMKVDDNGLETNNLIVENIYTKSILPNFAINYFKYFYMTNLSQKTTHYANIESNYLNLEERVASLEGVTTLLLNELCLANSKHRFCDTQRTEEILTTVDPYIQPTGAHDAYNIGDLVKWNDHIYKSKINANVWSPSAYPAGWELIL